MARLPRLHSESGFAHVMNRGARRAATFVDDHDRTLFLSLLAEGCRRFDVAIHAYCLMTNHYHLLLHGHNEHPSELMHFVGTVYTQRFNQRRGVDGPLFRGRFASKPVETDEYFLTLVRYIHRNPTAIDPGLPLSRYEWSSHGIHLGERRRPSWVDSSMTRTLLGNDPATYRRLIEAPDLDPVDYDDPDTAPWPDRQIQRAIELEAIEQVALELTGQQQSELFAGVRGRANTARLLALLLAAEHLDMSTDELAYRYRLGSTTSVRSALHRARTRSAEDGSFNNLVRSARNRLAS